MGDLWGIGGFKGGDKCNVKQIVKKNQLKNLKKRWNRKKTKKSYFFLLKMV